MQLNQVPYQLVPGETTELETIAAEQAVNAMPEEPEPGPFARFVRDIPAPVLWLGAMLVGLTLVSRGGRRR